MVKIRKANLEDCQTCYDLCNFPGILEKGDPPKKWWIESFVKENQIFLVAEKNNEVAGFIMGERASGDIGFLHLIVVKKEFQGKGIGKMLVKQFENECKNRKIKVILTYCYSGSESFNHILTKNNYLKGSDYHEFQKWLIPYQT